MIANINKKQSEQMLPSGYVWAKDSDFEWVEDRPWYGVWKYNGTADKVAIPHTIQGEKVTSYEGMFYETSVSGVYSDNPNITNMSFMFTCSKATSLDLTYLDTSGVTDMSYMFFNSKATSLDLSSFDISKVTNMVYIFLNSQATEGYARTQDDVDWFNDLMDKPSKLKFKVKQ